MGVEGRKVEDADTAKLAALNLAYYAFDVPSFTGGQVRRHVVCYSPQEAR